LLRALLIAIGAVARISSVRAVRTAGEELPERVKSPVPRRARNIRAGRSEAVNAIWIAGGSSGQPVNVLVQLNQLILRGDRGLLAQVKDPRPLGLLDRASRPRAVDEHGVELDRGVVIDLAGTIGALLLRRRDLALIGYLCGWPPPSRLPHGHDAGALITRLAVDPQL